jgi:hypothetical protein
MARRKSPFGNQSNVSHVASIKFAPVGYGEQFEKTFIFRCVSNFNSLLVSVLLLYGCFLILCGIVAVLFIGLKAKTALLSGGMSGVLSILIAYFVSIDIRSAPWCGIALSVTLLIVFSWRSSKTLFKLFELIPQRDPELNGKGIAFLIISLMAIVSLIVTMIQCALLIF